jgi:hypothetical protein
MALQKGTKFTATQVRHLPRAGAVVMRGETITEVVRAVPFGGAQVLCY